MQSSDIQGNVAVSDLFIKEGENENKRITCAEMTKFMKKKKYKRLTKYIENVVPPKTIRYGDLYRLWPPPICLIVISLFQILFFVLDANSGKASGTGRIAQRLIYNPDKRLEMWRFITYMFVHLGKVQLIINIFMQILLGVTLEMVHGWYRVLIIYLAGILAGSLGTSVFYPTVKLAGASGGVYALITAHIATIIMNWSETIYALYQTIILAAYIIADIVHMCYSTNDDYILHTTHFCGAAAGLLVGVMILRNIKTKKIENIIQIIAVVLYVILMCSAVIWNVVS